jgi:hypothetical protein
VVADLFNPSHPPLSACPTVSHQSRGAALQSQVAELRGAEERLQRALAEAQAEQRATQGRVATLSGAAEQVGAARRMGSLHTC